MNSSMQRNRSVLATLCTVGGILLLMVSFAGCGPSKEDIKKDDAVGKEKNDAMMQRMIQEQTAKPAAGATGAAQPGRQK